MKSNMRALLSKLSYTTASFVLAVSTLTAAVPFILAQSVSAVDTATYSPVNLSGWTTDRTYPSGGVIETSFAGRDTLQLTVDNESASLAPGFYRTEGVKKATAEVDSIKADLYVNSDWINNDKDIRAGLWSVGRDAGDAISAYPIVEFNSADGFTGWRIWNSYAPGGWVNTAIPYNVDEWNSLELTINATDDTLTDVYVNGTLVGQSEHSPTAYFREIILNSYNYATTADKNYSVSWSNIDAGVYAPNTAPAITFNAPTPADSAYVSDVITGNVTAEDDYGMGSYYLRFWKDAFEIAGGGTLEKSCGSAPGAFNLGASVAAECSFDTSSLADGTTLVVSAQFLDGHNKWGSAKRTFTVDNTNPRITNVNLSHELISSVTGNPVLTADIDDIVSGVAKVQYRVYGPTETGYIDVSYNSTTKSVDEEIDLLGLGLSDGDYSLGLRAFDAAGNKKNVGNAASSIQIPFTIDNTSPVISNVNLSEQLISTVSGNPTLTADINDAGSDVVKAQYKVYTTDGSTVAGYQDLTYNSTTKSVDEEIDLLGLPDGDYNLGLRAFDAAGNKKNVGNAASSIQIPFTIDNAAPTIVYTAYNTNDNVITPIITVDDEDVVSYLWTFVSGPTGGVAVSDETILAPDFTVSQDGAYVYRLTVTDAAGNESTFDFEFAYTTPVDETDNDGGAEAQAAGGAAVIGGFTPFAETAVLGDTTQNDAAAQNDANDEDVQSATDENDVAGTTDSDNDNDGILGFAWYWWLLIVAALGTAAWWIAAAIRRRNEEA